jgi:curli biogenesis system outer membrane secretion channel CsgG
MTILTPFLAAICLWQGTTAPQAPEYSGPKKRVAVSGFDLAIRELRIYSDYTPSGVPGHSALDIDAPSEFGEGLGDMLVTALIDSKRFVVLERRDFKDVTTELDLQQKSGDVKADSAVKAGQLLGAQILIRASLTELSYQKNVTGLGGGIVEEIHAGQAAYAAMCAVDIKLIDVETGQILDSVKGEGKVTNKAKFVGFSSKQFAFGQASFENSSIAKAIRQAVQDGVKKLVDRTEKVPWEAKIASISNDTLYLNFGANAGIKEGTMLEIFKAGKPIIDPDTKVVLGREEDTVLGKCRVNSLKPKFSTAVVTEGSGFDVGDGIRIPKIK